MSGRYTPGPIFVAETMQDDEGYPETAIRAVTGLACIAVAIDFQHAPGTREANAQRLVACWNALDGLSDEALDGGWNARSMSAYAKGLESKLAAARALLTEVVRPHDDHVKAVQASGEQPAVNPLAIRIHDFMKGGAT